jgi:1,4-dihydroxy-2-naphthoate octaprenyltransferase
MTVVLGLIVFTILCLCLVIGVAFKAGSKVIGMASQSEVVDTFLAFKRRYGRQPGDSLFMVFKRWLAVSIVASACLLLFTVSGPIAPLLVLIVLVVKSVKFLKRHDPTRLENRQTKPVS